MLALWRAFFVSFVIPVGPSFHSLLPRNHIQLAVKTSATRTCLFYEKRPYKTKIKMKISIVICAAGAGTRMGCPKALCRLPSERTFLEHIVQTAHRASISSIVVVTGAQAENVRQAHRHLDVTWCENKDWQSTYMLESLVCGLHHVPAHHMVLHWPVDCIGITAEDLCYLIQSPISPFAAPTNNGQPGHPLRISSPKVEILKSQHPFSSLKEFVASDICTKIEVKSDVLLNCNDREALQNFMLRMGGL